MPGKDQDVAVSAEEITQGKLHAGNSRLAALMLHVRGYVVLRGAVPPHVAAAAGEEFARVLGDCVASRDGDGSRQTARNTQAVFWRRDQRWRIFPRLRTPFDSPWLAANPFVVELIGRSLGDGFCCESVCGDVCQNGAVLQAPRREPDAGPSWEPRAYVVNVPLGRCGPEGSLEVWPCGSHLWRADVLRQLGVEVQGDGSPDADWLAGMLPSRRLALAPGDLLVRDPALLHRTRAHHTDRPRALLTACYLRKGAAREDGRAEYNLDRDLYERLDPRVKALFAYAFEPAEAAPAFSPGLLSRLLGKAPTGRKTA